MRAGFDAELADLLGGSSGGWSFWRAALAAIELALERSREREQSFCSHPPGELGRFLRDLDDALGLAATAVTVQQLVNAEPDHNDLQRRHTIAQLLQRRAREVGLQSDP